MTDTGRAINLHARHEHGGFPVKVITGPGQPRFEVAWPDGPQQYPSARQMIRALYNGGNTDPATARDPGMSFNRYFRLGDHAPKDDVVGPTIFDLFAASPLSPEPTGDIATKILQPAPTPTRRCPSTAGRWYRGIAAGAAITTLTLFGTGERALATPTLADTIAVEAPLRAWADPKPLLSVEAQKPTKTKAGLSVDPAILVRGIDLENRSHEVRKLLFAGFGGRISRAGYDPEDVLQEVYKGLLARNQGRCQFDPRKASFGHYVHMVCGCVLANYHRKLSRLGTHEQIGMYVSGEEGIGDAALAASNVPYGGDIHAVEPEHLASETAAIHSLQEYLVQHAGRQPLTDLAVECVPLLYMGHTRSEIARVIGIEPSKVGKALALIRSIAEGWGEQQGVVRA